LSITRQQVLAWRMKRHFLDPIASRSVTDVVDRLCGIQAQVASSAELAIRLRCQRSRPGDASRALTQGRLIKTWAMRGTLHLLTPELASTFLPLIASGRSWERPSWEKYFGVSADQIESLRKRARRALQDGPLTRDELIAAVTKQRGLACPGIWRSPHPRDSQLCSSRPGRAEQGVGRWPLPPLRRQGESG